jgi:hypothetical protein
MRVAYKAPIDAKDVDAILDYVVSIKGVNQAKPDQSSPIVSINQESDLLLMHSLTRIRAADCSIILDEACSRSRARRATCLV